MPSPQPQEEDQESTSTQAPAEPMRTLDEGLLRKFPTTSKASAIKSAGVIIAIILAGVGSGYLLSVRLGASQSLRSTGSVDEAGVKVGDVFGNPDKETFRDEAHGVLVKGGIDGEGSHRLLRPGGESQNVYLTSSVVDLELFVDHRVLVWGETFSAQKAGWLMDVGRVEVLELNAPKPTEEGE